MLDIAPSTENRSCSMMSLDLSPYLLSASPPISDFSLHSLSLASSFGPYSFLSAPSSRSPPVCAKVYGTSYKKPTLKSIMSVSSSRDDNSSNESLQTLESATSPLSQTSSETGSHSSRKGKRVSFADDAGRPLTEVRLMLDDPTSAPLLSQRSAGAISALENEEESNPPLIAPDPQPLERPNFEDDLRRNLVAVENVIVQGYQLTCTIYVDNRPSSKRVFGRCTTDSWQTFQDVTASFSQCRRPGYDSYQFILQVPAAADRSKLVQFAVCYEADGVQHWDNNEGLNYIVHWNRQAGAGAGGLASSSCSDDNNTNHLDLGGLVWCSHNSLDGPYY